ncbi:hypothetical protein M1271_01690 [Patescibacteria group bacterium]|nr:hypothetical protein [Patescibacteria group bacterium]
MAQATPDTLPQAMPPAHTTIEPAAMAPAANTPRPHVDTPEPQQRNAPHERTPSQPNVTKWKGREFGRPALHEIIADPRVMKEYQKMGENIGAQLEQYQDAGGVLLADQKTFLELYKRANGDFSELVKSEAGIIAIHVMSETELFRKLMVRQEAMTGARGDVPRPADREVVLDAYAGQIQRLSEGVRQAINQLVDAFGLIDAQGRLVLNRGAGAISWNFLPAEERAYLEYMRDNSLATDDRVVTELMETGRAHADLYHLLGVKLNMMGNFTSWDSFALTAAGNAQVNPDALGYNVASRWNGYRMRRAREGGMFVGPLSQQRRVEIWDKAQRETVVHFTERALELLNTEPGKVFRPVIEQLDSKRAAAAKPRMTEAQKQMRGEELEDAKARRTEKRSQLQTAREAVTRLEGELQGLRNNQASLQQEQGNLEGEIREMTEARSTIEREKEEARRENRRLYNDAMVHNNIGLARQYKTEWQEDEAEFNSRLAEVDRRNTERGLAAKQTRLTEVKRDLASIPTKERERQVKDQEVTQLTGEITNLETEILRLSEVVKDAEKPISASEDVIHIIDTAKAALLRYGQIHGELNDPDNQQEFSMQSLTDISQETIVAPPGDATRTNVTLLHGYSMIQRLVFGRVPGGVQAVDHARWASELLPPEAVADILVERFELTLNPGDRLEQALSALRTLYEGGSLSRVDLQLAIFDMMKVVENRIENYPV